MDGWCSTSVIFDVQMSNSFLNFFQSPQLNFITRIIILVIAIIIITIMSINIIELWRLWLCECSSSSAWFPLLAYSNQTFIKHFRQHQHPSMLQDDKKWEDELSSSSLWVSSSSSLLSSSQIIIIASIITRVIPACLVMTRSRVTWSQDELLSSSFSS